MHSGVRLIVLLFLAGFAASCRHIPLIGTGLPGLPPREEALKSDMAVARQLLDATLDWRGRATRFVAHLRPKLDGGVLTGADLDLLYRGGEDYVFLDRRWAALIAVQGEEVWRRAQPRLAVDPLARMQTKLVLAAALVQHDDYAVGVGPYFKQYKLRRLLKTDREALLGEIDAATRRHLDPMQRNRLARAVVWYRAEGGQATEVSADEAYLDEVIRQSPAYQFYSRALPERLVGAWTTGSYAAVTFVTDLLAEAGKRAVHTTSLTVGNLVGLVETRRGHLGDLSAAEVGALGARLRPGDVLLEKTPFRLTDKSIPGHYGHVAIWVGGEADLKAHGVWGHPLVRLHHERIRAGAGVVEALRSGVEINTLEHFLNVDDLLVLRRPLTEAQAREAVLRTFAQLGKEYDFNFDVESDRRIVCSELAFVVFTDVSWPTRSVLGRASITPDQVACRALADGPFVPVVMYHDGVEIREGLQEALGLFLRGEYGEFARCHPHFVGKSAAQ